MEHSSFENQKLALTVNEVRAFYEALRFITVFTRARHWTVFEPDESTPFKLNCNNSLIHASSK